MVHRTGMFGGQALVDIVTGVVSPSARLPDTIYGPSYLSQIPPSRDMSWGLESGGVGISYRYLTDKADVLFPFGFGLSYSRFALSISNSTLFSVNVTNLGPHVASETILLISAPGSSRSWSAQPLLLTLVRAVFVCREWASTQAALRTGQSRSLGCGREWRLVFLSGSTCN
jgi:hypothetical protein